MDRYQKLEGRFLGVTEQLGALQEQLGALQVWSAALLGTLHRRAPSSPPQHTRMHTRMHTPSSVVASAAGRDQPGNSGQGCQ